MKINEILKLHSEGMTTIEIAKTIGWKYGPVNTELRRRGLVGVKVRRLNNTLKLDYFKDINSEDKAYFLGLLHADGCVYTYNKKKGYKSCTINLKSSDRAILDKYSLFLGAKESLVNINTNGNGFEVAEVSVGKQEFVQHVLDLKSPNLVDRVPIELRRHFIRGYFDGNGTICYKGSKLKKHLWRMQLCGPPDIIDKLHDSTFWGSPRFQGKSMKIMRKATSKTILEFYHYIYDNSTVFLQRKKEKFDEAVFWITNGPLFS